MKTTVIFHRSDFDGIFCREIARKFLPKAELVGWDFADPPLTWPEGQIYILDLPIDRVFGANYVPAMRKAPHDKTLDRVIWIDHHKTSIDTHPEAVLGYRIDGVAACRLAWQWFAESGSDKGYLPSKQEFIDRTVAEPLAVRLAGEYDIWDKRDPDAETFQFGLRSQELCDAAWFHLLSDDSETPVATLLNQGRSLQRYQREQDASVAKRGFDVEFEGRKFLALNIARCNSLTFESAAQPHHDGLMGFYWDGKQWNVSLYHSPHHKEHDLSQIAVKFGGGGHRGACGFKVAKLPFIP